jgi:hypothetical protein
MSNPFGEFLTKLEALPADPSTDILQQRCDIARNRGVSNTAISELCRTFAPRLSEIPVEKHGEFLAKLEAIAIAAQQQDKPRTRTNVVRLADRRATLTPEEMKAIDGGANGKSAKSQTSASEDDGGPISLNLGADLDNMKVSAGWVSYAALTIHLPEAAEIIPGWEERGVVTYDEGGGGIGKSYIAEQESACIAAGHPVMGKPVEQCDVFYLNYEEPQDEFERRLERIRRFFGRTTVDGVTREQWYKEYSRGPWPQEREIFVPLDTSRLRVSHLRGEPGAHLLRVSHRGEIILTRFGREFLDMLAEQKKQGRHSYVVFDGLMDAILFEGGTRSDDSVARQVIALIDRWCTVYDFTGRAIIHPSRAGERTDTGSYAPAWTTKPRSIQTFRRVTLDGKTVTDTPADQVYTRRTIFKRSHGQPGQYVLLQYRGGIWQRAEEGGAEDPVAVAIDLALRQAEIGSYIKANGTMGAESMALTNQHAIITEYRRRTDAKHGAAHFLASLKQAAGEGKLSYQPGKGKRPAGYRAPQSAKEVVTELSKPAEASEY